MSPDDDGVNLFDDVWSKKKMTTNEPSKEKMWRDEFQKFIENDKSIHPTFSLRMIESAYLAASKARQAEIEQLKAEVELLRDRLDHEVAMIDGAAKDDIRLLNNTVEILNQIRDNLQDENRKLNTDLACAVEALKQIKYDATYDDTKNWTSRWLRSTTQALEKIGVVE